jgi:hypothetical protein
VRRYYRNQPLEYLLDLIGTDVRGGAASVLRRRRT